MALDAAQPDAGRAEGTAAIISGLIIRSAVIPMPHPKKSAVSLRSADKSTPASKVRVQFNSLVKKLESERERLKEWHEALPVFRTRVESEVGPLEDRYDDRIRDMVLVLDESWETSKLTKKEYENLSHWICDLCEDLLGVRQDKDLEQIFFKHSGLTEEDLEDDEEELSLEDELAEFAAFAKMLDGRMDAAAEAYAEDQNGSARPSDAGAKVRKPSPKEKRLAEEEVRLQQSVREIFRKLVSTLHPDRETDPSERARKTELMQRVNVAYEKNDLLTLLELQFEIDQLDIASLEAQGEDRIRQYNKVLKKQLDDVVRETRDLEDWLKYDFGLDLPGRLLPMHLRAFVDTKLEVMRERLAVIEKDLVDFKEVKLLKAFLKTYRIPKKDDFYFGPGYF